MNKKGESYYKILFLVSALYDFILGFAFLFFYKQIFALLRMNLPENPSYLTFAALTIMFFGVLLFMIYLDLKNSRRMILYAIFFKFSYIATVIYYYVVVGKAYVDFPFRLFAFFDLIFALLFLESLRNIKN